MRLIFFLLFYFSLSAALSGTDAAPRGVWIVFCYISEICSRSASSQPSLPTESSRPLLLRSAALWFRPSIITRKNSSGCLMNPRQKHSRINQPPLLFPTPPLPVFFFFFLLFTHFLYLPHNVLLMESQNIASITLRLFNLVLFFSSAFFLMRFPPMQSNGVQSY